MSCEDEHHNHNHGHNHNHNHVAPIPTTAGQSLNNKIDTSKVTALNMANSADDLAKVFKDSTKKYQIKPIIKSDSDEQMIINIPFLNGSVKLYSIILLGVANNDSDDLPEFLESNNDDDFVEHYVSRHKFTGVNQLTIFIEDIYDEGEEECHLHSIELRGEFTELNKDPVITLYESAANPADHKNLTIVENQNLA
ncbi:PITH domain family protein [Candida albicans]|uniref:PITH domain family protein n=1 Tax=Candida albicans TaxID=5476 RepID=A0A8H6BXG8_CANAX|nr:PITH domain family protein [Candida albicans]